MLDVHTLKLLGDLLNCPLLVFANESNGLQRYKTKEITYFGHYDYQDFDVDEILKFSFEHYLDLNSVKDKALVVCHSMNYDKIKIPDEFASKEKIYKTPSFHHQKLHVPLIRMHFPKKTFRSPNPTYGLRPTVKSTTIYFQNLKFINPS